MRKIYLTLSILFCLHFIAYPQSDTAHLTAIAGKLEKLTAARPIEKVYLQFNKPGYTIGDTMWFKAYVTVGIHHQPSAFSGVLYIDLIDTKDKIIKSLTLKNNNGVSAGDFVLDGKLPPGDYRVRAYTNWMRNAGPAYFFDQAVTVGDVRGDGLFVTPALAVNSNNDIVARLVYTDGMGRPFSQKPVIYEVRADTNLLYSGKGITDALGNLSFSFPGKTAPGQAVRIISHMQVIRDVLIDKVTPLNVPNDAADIQFFPEGGQLVAGVRLRVAFKAIGTDGLGIAVKGVVVDKDNNEVAEFSSKHAGMGVFALVPKSGQSYSARLTLSDGLKITRLLPAVADKGFVLSVSTADSMLLNVRIATNEATVQEMQGAPFYLIGQSAGAVYFTSAGKLDNTSFNIPVPKNRFPAGIAQFTLFSADNEPVNERIVFIRNAAGVLNLSLSSAKTAYAPKEKVSLIFNARDNTAKPAQGNFSLSVYNEDATPVNENTENSILSDLLLTSDLKGHIEEPGYYFNPVNEQATADLDVLMLTQGYRRFEWKEIAANNYPPVAWQPERSLSLSGVLTDSKGRPVAKGRVSALSVATRLSADTLSDEQGRFTLAGLNLTDSAKLVIQARREHKDKDVNIALTPRTSPPLYKGSLASKPVGFLPVLAGINAAGKPDTTGIATGVKNNPFAFNRVNNLKEVTVKQQRNNFGTENAPWMAKASAHSSNLNGAGHANRVLSSEELVDCASLFDCLQAKLPGSILIFIKGMPMLFFSRHLAQSLTSPPPIVFMVDGALIGSDLNYLDANVAVPNIETIEVLNSSSYLNVYGTAASGGLLIITTKNGSEDINKPHVLEAAPGVITANFKGFDKIRDFYVPKYTVKNMPPVDNRTAVYWNPGIITGENGSLPLEFFNSDVKGTYRAVVEGIDNDGNIGRFVYRYKVE